MGGGIKAAYLGNKLVYGDERWWVEDRQNIVANFIVYFPPTYTSLPFRNIDYVSIFINDGKYKFETNSSTDLSVDAGIDITIGSSSGYSGGYRSDDSGYGFDSHIAAQGSLTFQKYPDNNRLYLYNIVPEINVSISDFSWHTTYPQFKIKYYLKLYSESSGITNHIWDNRGNDWFDIGSNGQVRRYNIQGPQSKELAIPKDLYQIDLIFEIVLNGFV